MQSFGLGFHRHVSIWIRTRRLILLFAVCSVQQLGELDRYAPGVGEYQWREFLVVSPDFFGVGAVVFLVFSVFNRDD